MAFLNFIGVAFTVLRALPQALKLGYEVNTLIHRMRGMKARRAKLEALRDGFRHAKETGDTSKVEVLFRELCE
jgi:hypothetical protein